MTTNSAPTNPDPMERLLEVMARLRDPVGGCPWDIEQTYETIAPYTIEEAYEVAEAVTNKDMASLRDELGDLLLQVVYHARMAEEDQVFDFHDVADAIAEKMIRRHPHVFGDAEERDATTQTLSWEAQKATERAAKAAQSGQDARATSALDGVSIAYPALMRAAKLQKRAALVGFDWGHAAPIMAKFEEELAELREALDDEDANALAKQANIEEEIGDLLFTSANLARHLDVDPETALRRSSEKFESRFRRIEVLLSEQDGRTPDQASLDELEALWQQAKTELRS